MRHGKLEHSNRMCQQDFLLSDDLVEMLFCLLFLGHNFLLKDLSWMFY